MIKATQEYMQEVTKASQGQMIMVCLFKALVITCLIVIIIEGFKFFREERNDKR